jgi:uncharacterized membrane protein
MIKEIASVMILGKAVAFWLGVITIILLICTALIPMLNQKKWTKIPLKYHFVLGKITMALAIIHAILIASRYLGF